MITFLKTYFEMLSFRLRRVLVFAFLHYVDGQRRIKDGFEVKEDKGYMVYLVEEKYPFNTYNSWICGGSIVSRWFILTSAACIEDVRSVYVVSGLKRYVPHREVYKDLCAERTMKKIVFTCVPKEYDLDLKVENWSFNDIGLAKVELPYDFDEYPSHRYCQYHPINININFDVKNEQIGTEVIVLGYGHKQFWRQKNVNEDFNSPMQYSSSKIYSVEKCKNGYRSPDLITNIDKYMICTNGSGGIDETGKPLIKSRIRRTHHEPNFKMRSTRKNYNLTFNLNTRRQGFCQNDHGGPLVTWIGGNETVIGVASVFRINKERECIGPYLYTSTARNKLFIKCILDEMDHRAMRRRECYQPASVMGFSILRRYILWNKDKNHFLKNEEIIMRPQINMNFIREG